MNHKDEIQEWIKNNCADFLNTKISMPMPQSNTVTLCAEMKALPPEHCNMDLASYEIMIREELAKQLAQKLIEEDLITILSNYDILNMQNTFRAEVRVVQE